MAFARRSAMHRRPKPETGGSIMRRRPAVALVLFTTLSPMTALAQGTDSRPQTAALQQVVDEQLRRIEALEARLAQLQQKVDAITGQQPPPLAVPTPVDE